MSARRGPTGVIFLRGFQIFLAGAVAAASMWGLLGGCREQSTAPIDRNQPPETFITSAPGDSLVSFYRTTLSWVGRDPDGAVAGYEVSVTDSLPPPEEDFVWKRTRRSDSLMTFPVQETHEILGHRFYVRAIDNEGKVDPTPAWIFFGSKNTLPPRVELIAWSYGPGGVVDTIRSEDPDFPTDTISVGEGVRFRWTGSDEEFAIEPDGRVIQVGGIARFFYRLLPVESEYMGGRLTDVSREYDGAFFIREEGDAFTFNVKAVDNGGLTGSGIATRSFVWNRDPVSRIVPRAPRPGDGRVVPTYKVGDVVHFSGDTLPLPAELSGSIPISFDAMAFDPDPLVGDSTVALTEWRLSQRAVLGSWAPMTETTMATSLARTDDYVLMIRSMDEFERVETTPDSAFLYTNFPPRFVTSDGSFVQTPEMNNPSYALSDLQANDLLCRFMVIDPDPPAGSFIRFSLFFDGSVRSDVDPPPVIPYPGVLEVRARPERGWTVGDHTLRVLAEDNKLSNGLDNSWGGRGTERIVRFRVVDR